MTKPAAIKGSFADFRLVKTRKLAQVVIEIPIEEADHALTVLGGLPRSDGERWVAIARLTKAGADRPSNPADNLGSDTSTPIKASPATKRERTPAERAAFLCTLPEFRKWYGAPTEEAAAHQMRAECGVSSRAQITTNPDAHEAFKRIEDAFHRRNDPPPHDGSR
jgi:hypothetical protein